MKFIKYLFFLLLILFIGVALYFGTKDGDFSVTETRVINAPVEVVYQHVNDFKNWEKWGSWMQAGSLKVHYPEKTSGDGASYSWNGKEGGSGVIQTIKAEPDISLLQKIVFNGSLEEEGKSVSWLFEPEELGTKTKVSWSMEGTLGLFEKIHFAIQGEDLEASVHQMYAESLENLDRVLQEEMNVYSVEVNGLAQYSGGFYLYNTTASKQTEIGDKTFPMITQLQNYMKDHSLPAHGSPFVVYLDWDEMNKTTIFSVGIPTSDRVILPDGSPAISGYMPTMTAVKTTLTGRHTYLSKAWEEAEKYIQKNAFTEHQRLQPFEVYVKFLPEEKNPSKWVTEIYIPIEEVGTDNFDF